MIDSGGADNSVVIAYKYKIGRLHNMKFVDITSNESWSRLVESAGKASGSIMSFTTCLLVAFGVIVLDSFPAFLLVAIYLLAYLLANLKTTCKKRAAESKDEQLYGLGQGEAGVRLLPDLRSANPAADEQPCGCPRMLREKDLSWLQYCRPEKRHVQLPILQITNTSHGCR